MIPLSSLVVGLLLRQGDLENLDKALSSARSYISKNDLSVTPTELTADIAFFEYKVQEIKLYYTSKGVPTEDFGAAVASKWISVRLGHKIAADAPVEFAFGFLYPPGKRGGYAVTDIDEKYDPASQYRDSGVLTITSNVQAQVSVDGTDWGPTECYYSGDPVAVKIKATVGSQSQTKTCTVVAGVNTPVSFKF